MTLPIRLRWHTDGRVAINRAGDLWCVPFGREMTIYPSAYVSGPGWSELLVAELLEPDDEPNHDGRPVWTMSDGVTIVPHIGEVSFDGEEPESSNAHRSDVLKMLAAVAACEQYRSQREES